MVQLRLDVFWFLPVCQIHWCTLVNICDSEWVVCKTDICGCVSQLSNVFVVTSFFKPWFEVHMCTCENIYGCFSHLSSVFTFGFWVLLNFELCLFCCCCNYFDEHTLNIDSAAWSLYVGFKEQIYDVYRYLPPATQVLLISATLPHEILEMTNKFMTDPIRILVKRWVWWLCSSQSNCCWCLSVVCFLLCFLREASKGSIILL